MIIARPFPLALSARQVRLVGRVAPAAPPRHVARRFKEKQGPDTEATPEKPALPREEDYPSFFHEDRDQLLKSGAVVHEEVRPHPEEVRTHPAHPTRGPTEPRPSVAPQPAAPEPHAAPASEPHKGGEEEQHHGGEHHETRQQLWAHGATVHEEVMPGPSHTGSQLPADTPHSAPAAAHASKHQEAPGLVTQMPEPPPAPAHTADKPQQASDRHAPEHHEPPAAAHTTTKPREAPGPHASEHHDSPDAAHTTTRYEMPGLVTQLPEAPPPATHSIDPHEAPGSHIPQPGEAPGPRVTVGPPTNTGSQWVKVSPDADPYSPLPDQGQGSSSE